VDLWSSRFEAQSTSPRPLIGIESVEIVDLKSVVHDEEYLLGISISF